MIRISTRMFWYHEKPDFLDWLFSNPKGWSVAYGKISWGPYTEEEYSKRRHKQQKSPVHIGHHNSKVFWWYRDDFIVCDEDVDEDVIVGWHAKQQALRQARLEKYKELGKAVQVKAKSKTTQQKEKNLIDAALALVSLGYKKTEAIKAVRVVSDVHPRATLEKLVKEALKRL